MVKVIDVAKHLHSLGYKIINLKAKGKEPFEVGWSKNPRKKWVEIERQHRDGMNMGACLGKWSRLKDGYYAAALDCDVKSNLPKHNIEMKEALSNLIPNYISVPTTQSGRGGGSCHVWFKTREPATSFTFARSNDIVKVKMPSTPAGVREKKDLTTKEVQEGFRLRPAWEISVMSEGRQIVLPGSIHPDTGKTYNWIRQIKSAQDLPLIEISKLTANKIIPNHLTSKKDFEKFKAVPVFLNNYNLSPRILAMLTRGDGVQDHSAAIYGVSIAMFKAGMSEEEILSVLTNKDYYLGNTAYEHANSQDRSTAASWLSRFTLQKARAIAENPDFELSNADASRYPVFPEDARIGVVKEFLDLVEPETEADAASLTFQLLAMAGNVFGRNSYFVVSSVQHYPNLFVGIVGDSSKARKGTALSIFEKKIVENIEPLWAKTHIQSGLSSSEGLIYAVRDSSTKTNSRGELEILEGVEDKRLLIVESEFSSVLKQTVRSGNTLSALLRQAWDGKTLQTMTKNAPAIATETHISMIGHITREELVYDLNGVEIANGFANRFIWVSVKRSKLLADGGAIENLVFDRIIKKVKKALDFARKNQRITFSENSLKLWKKEYEQLSEARDGIIGKLTARSEAQTLRLALILALLDCSKEIKTFHLKAALSLWDYSLKSCEYIWGNKQNPTKYQKLLTFLENGPIDRTTITRNVFQGNKSKEEIQTILNELVSQKRIEFFTENNREMWRLVRTTNNEMGHT